MSIIGFFKGLFRKKKKLPGVRKDHMIIVQESVSRKMIPESEEEESFRIEEEEIFEEIETNEFQTMKVMQKEPEKSFMTENEILKETNEYELLIRDETNEEDFTPEEGGKMHHREKHNQFSPNEIKEEKEEGVNEEPFCHGDHVKEPASESETEYNYEEAEQHFKASHSTINHSKMNETHSTEETWIMSSLPVELQYLDRLIRYGLAMEFHKGSLQVEPALPPYEYWDLPLGKFAMEENLSEDEARILLIGLVHHVQPDLFDTAIDSVMKGSGDFPKIGGTRGKNFRGFMPTGETVLFLLAGDDWRKRLKIQQLFWADHLFAQKRILWLEEISVGEPAMSGKITLSQDYIDLFTQDKIVPPQFSISFPAKLVTTDRDTSDLILNTHLENQLKDVYDWLDNNKTLFMKGGSDGRFRKGYRSLFYGPPGTGKTFAACILGKLTDKEVYRIDLSMIVSKYIGETEKNLELLFARAENKKWILFFDEADALFGKRTNVRDAHDKYANQEVSYLLQRIEDYDGLVILASNMKNNIDDAFIRRFNSVLYFPMPEEEDRKKIWKKTFLPDTKFFLDLPGENELMNGSEDDQEPLDLAEIVKKYELSGGNIANIIHYASIKGEKRVKAGKMKKRELINECGLTDLPEEPEEKKFPVIYMTDVIAGIRHELSKDGIPFV